MATPALEREGCRVGGLLTDRIAIVGRCDSNATAFGFNLYLDEARTIAAPGVTYTDGVPTAGNNYQATAYAIGLQANTRYYWEAIASDDVGNDPRAGNQVVGTGPLYSGSFRTISTDESPWKVGLGGCLWGWQIGVNSTNAGIAANICRNIIGSNLDAFFWIGDIYYADTGTDRGDDPDVTPYTANSWFNQIAGVDDGSLARFRTNFITTMDGNAHFTIAGINKTFGHVMASMPGYYMWDDHDRSYNDCDDLDASEGALGIGEANKILYGHQVGHECFMDLNKELIDQEPSRDFATDCQAETTTPAEYYYVDIPPVRFIVLDGRDFRDANAGTDTASKTMLGATQKAWCKALIAEKAQRYTVIVSPLMLDGDHGVWIPVSSTDHWKGFSFERDEILDYIWDNGEPHRTVIFSADTHIGAVIRYDDSGARQPIYEVSASNAGWISSGHGWLTGVKDTNFRPGETVGASGKGGKLMMCRIRENNLVVIEADSNEMRVKLVEVNPQTGPNTAQTVWQRAYK